MVRASVRLFVASQQWLSEVFDRLLPAKFRVVGKRDFVRSVVPTFLDSHGRPGLTVYDVGGGKSPLLPAVSRRERGFKIVGLDVRADELALAPSGAYDEVICTDLCRYTGRGDADLVVCQAVLEHVPDVEAALGGIATILRPGGHALLFLPSRNALFARLNLLLPEGVKRALLFSAFPEKREKQGFPARYDRCTPAEVKRLAGRCGLEVEAQRLYYHSSYFSCFFPCYVLWRAWLLTFYLVNPEAAAETFCLTLRKPDSAVATPAGEAAPDAHLEHASV